MFLRSHTNTRFLIECFVVTGAFSLSSIGHEADDTVMGFVNNDNVGEAFIEDGHSTGAQAKPSRDSIQDIELVSFDQSSSNEKFTSITLSPLIQAAQTSHWTNLSISNDNFYASINLSVDFLSTAQMGETVKAQAKIERKGSTITNAYCTLFSETGVKIAIGRSNLIRTNIPIEKALFDK